MPSFPSGIAEKMGFKNPFTASVVSNVASEISPNGSGKIPVAISENFRTLKKWWLEGLFSYWEGKLFRGELLNFRGAAEKWTQRHDFKVDGSLRTVNLISRVCTSSIISTTRRWVGIHRHREKGPRSFCSAKIRSLAC